MAQSKKINTSSYILLIIIICYAFFLPFFLNPELLTVKDNDLGRTYVPMFSFIRNSFFTYKNIPLWRDDQMMGESLAANPISSLFYPANLIFLIFPIHIGSIVYYFVHILLAALATFLLGKSFGFNNDGSLAASVFYAFSTKMLLHLSAGHITMVAAFSFFPIAFLAAREVLKRPSAKWLIIGISALASMLITYPTIFYYASIFVLLYIIYFTLWHHRDWRTSAFRNSMLTIAGMFLVTIFLSSISLLPQMAFGPLSTRSQLSFGDVAVPLWNAKRYFTSLLFPYFNFQDLDQEAFLYLGLVPTFLALIGFFKLETKKRLFLASIGLLTILFTLGQSTPVFGFMYETLPLLKYSRVTTRLWIAVALVVALLAASSIQKIKKRQLIWLILAFFLIENFFIAFHKMQSTDDIERENISLYEFITLDKDTFRVYCTTNCFNPQLLSEYNIHILNGETPIQDTNFVKFLAKAGNYKWESFAVIFPPYQVWQTKYPPIPDAKFLGEANVKYVTSTYPLTDSGFSFQGQFEDIYLYKNSQFKPRFYFENSNDSVYIESYEPNRIIVSFPESSTPRKLVFAQNYIPGWIASQNHLDYLTERYKDVFTAVTVLPGVTFLEYKYQPQGFIIGKAFTLGAIIFLLLYFWYTRYTRNRHYRA